MSDTTGDVKEERHSEQISPPLVVVDHEKRRVAVTPDVESSTPYEMARNYIAGLDGERQTEMACCNRTLTWDGVRTEIEVFGDARLVWDGERASATPYLWVVHAFTKTVVLDDARITSVQRALCAADKYYNQQLNQSMMSLDWSEKRQITEADLRDAIRQTAELTELFDGKPGVSIEITVDDAFTAADG